MKNAYNSFSSASSLQAVWNARRSQILGSCFGPDRVTGKAFAKNLPANLERIRAELAGRYEPRGLLAFAKPKVGGGNRIICVPTVADRIVQFAILEQLRPRLRRSGLDNSISFGLAAGRSRSVIGARQFACGARDDHPWVYKADIHKFFDNLDRNILLTAVEKVVSQKSLRAIICLFLTSEIEDGVEVGWRKLASEAGIRTGVGVRQGMPLSPFFAGAYLRGLDRWLKKQSHPVARYVDDIVAFFDSEKAAQDFHRRFAAQLSKLGLIIGEIGGPSSKTQIYAPGEAADFLGMQIVLVSGRHRLCVSMKTMEKISDKFVQFSTVAGVAEKGVNLTTMGSYFAAVQCGYLNAYDGAHNFEDLKRKLGGVADGARNSVLIELFGDKLETMTPAQLRFVGLN